jgi:hypothetical protein
MKKPSLQLPKACNNWGYYPAKNPEKNPVKNPVKDKGLH